MILYLEKRGCNFFNGDQIRNMSDVGNYRVTTTDCTISGKDGIMYFLEFTHLDYKYRFYRKDGTGKLKKPIREKLPFPVLLIDTEYENDRGTWGNLRLNARINAMNLPYTKDGILQAVNTISNMHYDSIEFIN